METQLERIQNTERDYMKRDKSAVNYANLRNIKYFYVDTKTGEVLQFGTSQSRIFFERKCNGMFPERQCKVYSLPEYLKETE